MRLKDCFTGLTITMVLCLPALAISSSDLINNAHRYDNRKISYQGEVVGDIMIRGDHAWLNVNDGKTAIGVWAKKDLLKNVKTSGSYRYTGDTIRVTGTFQRACPIHGGDLDIHAKEIKLVKPGQPISHPIQPSKFVVAGVLLIATLVLVFIPRIIKKH